MKKKKDVVLRSQPVQAQHAEIISLAWLHPKVEQMWAWEMNACIYCEISGGIQQTRRILP